MHYAALLLVMLLAAGCATAPDWERAGATRVEQDRDLAAVFGGGPDGRSASGRGRRWSGSQRPRVGRHRPAGSRGGGRG